MDSLKSLIDNTKDYKIKADNMVHIWWWYFQEQNYHKAFEVLNKAKLLATSINDSDLILKCNGNLGFHYKYLKNYGASIFYFKQAQKFITKNDKQERRMISLFDNLSECYNLIGNYQLQKKYVDSSIKINMLLNDSLEGFYNCSALAKYYFSTKNYKQMLSIIDSSLIHLKAPAWEKLIVGTERMNYLYAINKTNQKSNINWSQITRNYYDQYQTLLKNRGADLTPLEITRDYFTKANYYLTINDLKKALSLCDKIEKDNKHILSPEFNVPYMQLKFDLCIKTKNLEGAKTYFDKIQLVSDSIELALHKNNAESIEALLQGENELEKEKTEKQEKIILANESKKQTKITIIFSLIILILLCTGIYLLRKKLKNEKEQKEIIRLQKEIVDEKQKEITDSINYAKRIQAALMAPEEVMKTNLYEYFLYFLPKDIVSGDFYWATKLEDYFFLAICDSTGHGIPGSFMSLINISYLNEAVNEKKLIEPNEIFDYSKKRLIETLSKEGQKDGFDGVLLRINYKTRKIAYAAANNAPVMIKNNTLIELEKDKMPVGNGENNKLFTRFEVSFEKGDLLYAFTDGYSDQFGGEKNKKLKKRKLLELIHLGHTNNTLKQKQVLEIAFKEWKGDNEQVDDICVFGMKL